MSLLQDNFSRVIDYLRISVTDRCNLRCIYCMPPEGVRPSRHSQILKYEEIIRIANVAAGLGVKKIRITGGEPLTRKNIVFLVNALKKIQGIEDLSMTTNGILLGDFACQLADAGLDRVNVSIDSFIAERYRMITRGGSLDRVLHGLRAAERAGLKPVKINMVPIRGVNEDEVSDFARLTLTSEFHVRFIECMPSGSLDFWQPEKYMTSDDLKRTIEMIAPLTPVRIRRNGPSKYFRMEGGKGVIGFISALTHHFCEDCNRLRLTADGKLRPCLFSETEIDLRPVLRRSDPDDEIERLLKLSMEIKPKGHSMGPNSYPGGEAQVMRRHNGRKEIEEIPAVSSCAKRPMSRIGG